MTSKIELKKITLNITMRCTLKCKLCAIGAPYYENPPHYEVEYIYKVIDKAFETFGYIGQVQFAGGEPFMHKDLDRMIEKTMTYDKSFNNILIITNGTIMPVGKLAETLIKYKDRVSIQMSHYGELSRHADDIIAFCSEHGIKCIVKKYFGEEQYFGGWIDFGDLHKYNRSEKELKEVFSRCTNKSVGSCYGVYDGKIHWCAPSGMGMLRGKVPNCSDDYIDLLDESESIEEKREKFIKMHEKTYILACDYCSGDFGTTDVTKRVKAAEQLE